MTLGRRTSLFALALLIGGLACTGSIAQQPRPPLPPSDDPPIEAAREALPPGENLIAPPPPGWVLAYSDRDDDRSVYEYIPGDQNPDDPHDVLAIEVLNDAKGVSPAGLLERERRSFEQDCEGAVAEPAQDRALSGRPGARQFLLCGKARRGGKGQAVLRQVVVGQDASYIVERGWRGEGFRGSALPPAVRALVADWHRALDAIRLCDTRDQARPCK